MPQYSPERRTALVLCGTGVHGAYHAGVLRALQEAGVKIDIMAGQGVGAAGATLAAIDGSPRLFEADGLWRSATTAQLYRWTWPVRAAAWLALVPLPLLCLALVAAPYIPLTITRVAFGVWGALIAALVAAMVIAERRNPSRRRATGSWWWRVAGAPLDGQAARDLFAGAVWTLIHGAAPEARPSTAAAGRRYAEVLAEGLGQPGFRELMVIATDVDTRRDVIAAMLREPHRQEFLAARPGHERRADVLDLAGAGRDHALDLMAAALTPPVGCDPQLVTFAHDSFWRGETHRLCDRPGAVSRLLEELAIAGATQAIIVSAVPRGSALIRSISSHPPTTRSARSMSTAPMTNPRIGTRASRNSSTERTRTPTTSSSSLSSVPVASTWHSRRRSHAPPRNLASSATQTHCADATGATTNVATPDVEPTNSAVAQRFE